MSCSSCCCGGKKVKRGKLSLKNKLDDITISETPKSNSKNSRSISWECLPFSSKKNKNNHKSAKKSKKKNEYENTIKNQIDEKNQEFQKVPSETANLNRVPNAFDKITSEPTKQHQPYTTNLVNSGFGFGFDLQGGDQDNQLTFIINVQPNGDASRKGLQDGDILVSIQSKNVIGIRRVAIERILKQYKVDQEIEIVVCRLKDPSFILNPLKKNQSHSKSSINSLEKDQIVASASNISKYRSINEQIFSELISFQDSYLNSSKSTSSSRTSDSNSPLNSSSKTSMIKIHEKLDNNVSKTETDFDITDHKAINIELNRNCRKKNQNEITLRSSNNQKNRRLNTEHLALSNSAQYSSDSGYIESNRKSFCQSDISILLYDNIVGSAGNRLSTSNTHRPNLKNDVLVVSVTQQQAQFYHPQIQPLHAENYQYIAKNMQPLTLNSVKSMSMSVNDFTGSILAADKAHLLNKQQCKQLESTRRSISNSNGLDKSRIERYNNQAFIYLQQSPINKINNQQEQTNEQLDKIKFNMLNTNKFENQNQLYDPMSSNEQNNYSDHHQKYLNNCRISSVKNRINQIENNIVNEINSKSCTNSSKNQELNKEIANEAIFLSSSSTSSTSSNSSSFIPGQNETNLSTSKRTQNYETNHLLEIPISIPVFETSNKPFTTKHRYKTELTPITSVTSFELSNSSSSFGKKPLENIISSGSSSSISSIKQNLENSIDSSSSIDFEKINSSSPKKQEQQTIMPRASRKKTKPYQLTCSDPSVSLKQIEVTTCTSIGDSTNKQSVSLKLPIDSQTVQSDEELSSDTVNLVSLKANSLISLDKTDGYSDLSIKYIDDNASSVPMSPSEIKATSEITDIDASEILDDRKNNICLIEINHESNNKSSKSDDSIKKNLSKISKKSKKDRRKRHTIPILSNKDDSTIRAKKTKSQDSLINLSSISSSESENDLSCKNSIFKSNSFDYRQRRENLRKKLNEKAKSVENILKNDSCENKHITQNLNEWTDKLVSASKEADCIEAKKEENIYYEINDDDVSLKFDNNRDLSFLEINDQAMSFKKKSKQSQLSLVKSETQNLSSDESIKTISDGENLKQNYALSDDGANNEKKLSLVKKHDSSDALDSASSYEIRFERKPSLSRIKQKSFKEKLAEKNLDWNIPFEESTKHENGHLAVDSNIDDLTSSSCNSNSFSCSTEINLQKQTSYLETQNELKPNSNLDSSSSEFSPRMSKIQNDSIEIDDLENPFTSSSIMANSLNYDSDPKNEQVKSKSQPSILVEEIAAEKVNEKIINVPSNRVISSLSPSIVLDDGYGGSTVSLKQTNNESCSSIDESEVSVLSSLSNIDNKKSQTRKISRESKDLSFVKDSSEMEECSNDIRVEHETKESINAYDFEENNLETENGKFRELSPSSDQNKSFAIEEKDELFHNFKKESESSKEKDLDSLTNVDLSTSFVEQSEIKENNCKHEITHDDLNESDKLTKELFDQENNRNSAESNEFIEDFLLTKNIPLQSSFDIPRLETIYEKNLENTINESELNNFKKSESNDFTINKSTNENYLINLSSDTLDTNSYENKNEKLIYSNDENKYLVSNEENQISNKVNLSDQLIGCEGIKLLCTNEIEKYIEDSGSDNILLELDDDNYKILTLIVSEIIEKISNDIAQTSCLTSVPSKLDEKSNKCLNESKINFENMSSYFEAKIDDNMDNENVNQILNNQANKENNENECAEKSRITNVSNSLKPTDLKILAQSACDRLINNSIKNNSNKSLINALSSCEEKIDLKFDQADTAENENTEAEKQYRKNEAELVKSSPCSENTILNKINSESENELLIQSDFISKENQTETIIKNDKILEINKFLLKEENLNNDEKVTKQNLEAPNQTHMKIVPSVFDQFSEIENANDKLDHNGTISNEENDSLTNSYLNSTKTNDISDCESKSIADDQEVSNIKVRKTIEFYDDDLIGNDLIPPAYYKRNENVHFDNTSLSSNTKIINNSSSEFNSLLSNDTTTTIAKSNSLPRVVSSNKSFSKGFDSSITNVYYNNNNSNCVVSSSSYKSNIAPRSTVISKRVKPSNQTLNGLSLYSSQAVASRARNSVGLVEIRDKEKNQLKELNETFATYVERVKFLEASNKKLEMELIWLKKRQGHGLKQIENMYKIESEEAKNVLKEVMQIKGNMDVKLNKSEKEMDIIKEKYNGLKEGLNEEKIRIKILEEEILTNEAELGLLKRTLADLRDDEYRLKQETSHLISEVNRISNELENEMKQRLVLETDKQALEEELIFLKEMHTKELQEIKNQVVKDTGFDPTQYFKNELTNAIRQIREEFEHLNLEQRNDLEKAYSSRIAEIRNRYSKPVANIEIYTIEQIRKLKNQINESRQGVIDLKAKNALLECRIKDLEEEIIREQIEGQNLILEKENEHKLLNENLIRVKNEYDDLVNSKCDLEYEIETYRKLLEGEENRNGLKQLVENIELKNRILSVQSNEIQ
ncbi:unnamed protein product [Brachionus calyciflorus]|uniref:Uncharacterized protein n=1 Tax=Brachionus calyciflorus TaxID=104777 RepID=A0A813M8E6_9BILA|nr:unnamed protein product [Brachionus calyciflorus]